MNRFLKEWGLFLVFFILFILSRLFIWQPVLVDGHSMDPTLNHRERLIVIKTTSIERFDIVVAQEVEDGKTKEIVKRVIGMPGDTISYKNDVLTVNGEQVDEPYLEEYIAAFNEDKLQSTYSYNQNFQQLAAVATAFTTDSQGQAEFTVTVPEGEYYLVGDDRLVSKDSRDPEVGTFKRAAIKGEVKFRFWPFKSIGGVD